MRGEGDDRRIEPDPRLKAVAVIRAGRELGAWVPIAHEIAFGRGDERAPDCGCNY